MRSLLKASKTVSTVAYQTARIKPSRNQPLIAKSVLIFAVPNEPREPQSGNTFDSAVNSLGDAIERNLDRGGRTAALLDRTLISLSAGALVLSSTFVTTFAPKRLLLPLLFFAWVFFVLTILFVILAMRSAQNATEQAVRNASKALKTLEKHPHIAREFIEKFQLPLAQKHVSEITSAINFNNCALATFTLGIVCLLAFTGYNLWKTPPAPAQSSPKTSDSNAKPRQALIAENMGRGMGARRTAIRGATR